MFSKCTFKTKMKELSGKMIRENQFSVVSFDICLLLIMVESRYHNILTHIAQNGIKSWSKKIFSTNFGYNLGFLNYKHLVIRGSIFRITVCSTQGSCTGDDYNCTFAACISKRVAEQIRGLKSTTVITD